jgi:plasmid stabilization system protein ParE
MSACYVLAPQAAQDLVEIWRYIQEQSSAATADRVESTIKNRIAFLSQNPGAGHWRKDLIVYRPDTKPLQVVSILHGRRDMERVLKNRS